MKIRKSRRSLAPLTVRPIIAELRPALLVGVGADGTAAVQGGAADCVVVDEQADEELWRASLEHVMHRPGADRLLRDAAFVPIVVVGRGTNVLAAWSRLGSRIQSAARHAKVCIVVLEMGEGGLESIPEQCCGWFRLSRHYADGCLTGDELSQLAARLIERQVIAALFAAAWRMQATSPITLTTTLAWRPEASTAEVVACQLRLLVRRALLKPGTSSRPELPLIPASSRVSLTGPLRRQFAEETSTTLAEFFEEHAASAVGDFESNVHTGEARSVAAADQWCEQVWQAVLDALVRVWTDASELAAVRKRIRVTVACLRRDAQAAERRERRLATETTQMGRLGRVIDARRLASRGLMRWWRTLRTRRRLARFLRSRGEMLSARHESRALRQMSQQMERLDQRLDELLADSQCEEQALRRLLEPHHPCLFPLHDFDTLRLVVEQRAERLARSTTESSRQAVWRLAVSDVVADLGTGNPPWRSVDRAASAIAGELPDAEASFAADCGVLAPQYREARLRQLMLRSASPARSAATPTQQLQLVLEAGGGREPIALCLRWGAEPLALLRA